jgi:hypothetical protein
MKDLLLQIIDDDATYNKSATRYLYRSHPNLWKQIVDLTQFLPESAKPKQRIWHVINEINEIPKCPIENIELKWWENRYLTTSSHSAKIKLQHQRGDFANGHAPEINEKRRQGNLKAVVQGRKYRTKETYTESQKEKNKTTCLEKYGVKNGSQTKESRKKISDTRIKNGATPKHLRSLRRLYYDTVWRFTEESWKQEFDKINPTGIRRSENALDHVYSIQQGFRDTIPPYIIGHWTNLRILPMVENSIKGMRCDKTQNQLFDDFFSCVTQ